MVGSSFVFLLGKKMRFPLIYLITFPIGIKGENLKNIGSDN